ncbi:uroporphyrinogen-III C-methyltransferase [Rhodocyclaceae bacterium SMB388]
MNKENPALTQPPVADKEANPLAEDADARDASSDRAPEAEPAPSNVTASSSDAASDAGTTGATVASDAASIESTEARDEVADSSEPPPPPMPPLQADAGGNAPRGRLALAISLLALVGVGLIGWQVWELRALAKETRQEVAERLNAGDSAVAEIRALTRQQQELISAIQGRFGALQSQVAATEGQAASLEALYMEYSRSRSDQALAEVEQAINIAAQQLQLAGNFEAALIALQGAEARLAMPDQGHLQALRRALIKDIDALKAHPQLDVSGVALRLEILLERMDSLPLAFEIELAKAAEIAERKAAAQAGGKGDGYLARTLDYAEELATDLWNEVKGMVRLERMDSDDPVLLAPAQSTYLRENVKIRLLTARLALLARDAGTYTSDLQQAREWIERYFQADDEQVQRTIADLTELEKMPIKAEQPSLTETFAALRLVQARSAAPGAGTGRDSSTAPAADPGTR